MKRRAGVWTAVVLAAVLSLAAMRAMAYLHVNLWVDSNFTDPVTISAAQAYRFALDAAGPLGGLPPDARLNWTGGTTMMQPRAGTHRMSYFFMWHPRENALEFGDVNDMAMAQVVSVPNITCLRADCSRYTIIYRPQLQSFMRTWHPAWWRAWLQARIRNSASFVAPPHDVRTSCAGGVDTAAFRRVVGNARQYLMYTGMGWPVPVYARELAVPGTTIARFAPSAIAQEHGQSVSATQAVVSDTPPKQGRYRVVWLRVHNPWPWQRKHRGWVWLRFASDDLERTCKGAVRERDSQHIAFSDQVLRPGDLAADAVYRSTEEARRRTHNAQHLRDAQLVSVVRTPSGAIVRTRHDEGAQRWIGTFTYDDRGALILAEYQRSVK